MPKRELQPLRIGIAQVSTHDQNLKMQLDALKKTGCKRIFTDKLSGAQVERPGLKEALSHLRTVYAGFELELVQRSAMDQDAATPPENVNLSPKMLSKRAICLRFRMDSALSHFHLPFCRSLLTHTVYTF